MENGENRSAAKTSFTRRGFLGLAAVGALAAGASVAGCAPTPAASKEGNDADEPSEPDSLEDIDESQISETKEFDVVVVGLGVSGVAALRAAAEAGAHVVAVEKTSTPNCRSSMFAAFNCETARSLGIPDMDPTEIANELMIQMAHRGDYRVINTWLARCGEAFDWYPSGNAHRTLADAGSVFPCRIAHAPRRLSNAVGRIQRIGGRRGPHAQLYLAPAPARAASTHLMERMSWAAHTAKAATPTAAPTSPTSATDAIDTTAPPIHVPPPMPTLKMPEYTDIATADSSGWELLSTSD